MMSSYMCLAISLRCLSYANNFITIKIIACIVQPYIIILLGTNEYFNELKTFYRITKFNDKEDILHENFRQIYSTNLVTFSKYDSKCFDSNMDDLPGVSQH